MASAALDRLPALLTSEAFGEKELEFYLTKSSRKLI
jgi:hypothetical protein